MQPNDQNDRDHNKKSRKHSEAGLDLAEYRLVPVEAIEDEDEDKDTIDLVALAKTVWDKRKTVYKVVGIFFVIGLLIAFLSPVEYQTQATLMPELPSSGGGSGAAGLLQKYGGLLGINSSTLGSSDQSAINPVLYPNIIQSTPFMLELMSQKVHSAKYDTTLTVFTYFNEVYTPSVFSYLLKYTIGLPGQVKKLFSGKKITAVQDTTGGVIHLSNDQKDVIKKLSNRLSASVDEQSGIITISSEMPEAEMSAILAQKMIVLLKNYVTDYRTQKATQDYDFIKGQYEQAKVRFQKAQDTLAKFQDQNLNLATAQSQTQLKRLQDEYNLAYNVYNGLAQQLEQARIQVQQNTPVFKVLEPATVPINKEKPKRILIILVAMVFGFTSVTVLVLLKSRLK